MRRWIWEIPWVNAAYKALGLFVSSGNRVLDDGSRGQSDVLYSYTTLGDGWEAMLVICVKREGILAIFQTHKLLKTILRNTTFAI